jgi:hypothetical protein
MSKVVGGKTARKGSAKYVISKQNSASVLRERALSARAATVRRKTSVYSTDEAEWLNGLVRSTAKAVGNRA